MVSQVRFSVFTKPWPNHTLAELARHVRAIGFDAIELPVRPKFQVQPDAVGKRLVEAVRTLADEGVRVSSVAADPATCVIEACAAAGVPLIRVMVRVPVGARYMNVMDATVRSYEALLPALDGSGVAIAVQNHCNRMISSAMGLRHLVRHFDPRHVTAALDFAHCALAGEHPDEALDQVLPHVGLVNLKNGYWHRKQTADGEQASWAVRWVPAREGMCSWSAVAAALAERAYRGDVCLTAEYSDHDRVDDHICDDLAYARQCFEQVSAIAEPSSVT